MLNLHVTSWRSTVRCMSHAHVNSPRKAMRIALPYQPGNWAVLRLNECPHHVPLSEFGFLIDDAKSHRVVVRHEEDEEELECAAAEAEADTVAALVVEEAAIDEPELEAGGTCIVPLD